MPLIMTIGNLRDSYKQHKKLMEVNNWGKNPALFVNKCLNN